MTGTRGDDDGISEVKTSSGEENGKTKRNPSLISLAIARTASKPAGVSSMDAKELISALYEGVLLDEDKVKFWVDEKLNKNCFMLLCKALYVKTSHDPRYWSWIPHHEDCYGGPVEVGAAQLNYIWNLEVSRDDLPSIMLSPKTTYEVVFVLKMNENAEGWDVPITFGLRLPNGPLQNRMVNLGEKPRGEWIEIQLGEFVATRQIVGYIHVSLKDASVMYKKQGMVVRGVVFRPKY